MRAIVILLLFVIAAAEDAPAEEAFPVPAYYATTEYLAPLTEEEVVPLQAAFPKITYPNHLGAWAKAEGRPAPCWKTTPLELTGSNWTGSCMGLTKVPEHATAEACKAACTAEAMCPSWQFNTETHCFMGIGTSCNAARPDLKGDDSQRLMHGDVTVLVDTKAAGYQIMGLTKVGQFTMPDGSKAQPAEGADLCKHYCYSSITCQYWQFSKTDGCWYDSGDIAGLLDGLDEADYKSSGAGEWDDTMVAGEIVQHFCPPETTPTLAPIEEPEPKPKETDLTWLWITLGVIAALIAAAIAYYFLQPKPVKKRAVVKKPAPAPAPVPKYTTTILANGAVSTQYVGETTQYTGDPRTW